MKRLKEVKGTIEYIELFNLLEIDDYKNLCVEINRLVYDEVLIPVKIKEKTKRTPSICRYYKINKKTKDCVDQELIDEIKSISANLDYTYYLKHPEKYRIDRNYVQKLDKFFLMKRDSLSVSASINERSMEIWGEEKYLKDKGGMKLLNNVKIDISKLNVYATPEPFFYHKCSETINNVLIIENKDTWYTARKILKEGFKNILGLEVDLLVYGEGKKIESSIYFLEEDFKPINKLNIYYWGDIDFEGISIFNRLKCNIDNIDLLREGYELMLSVYFSEEFEAQHMKKDQRLTGTISCLEKVLTDCDYKEVKKLLELEHKYIPQEIVNYKIMKGVRR